MIRPFTLLCMASAFGAGLYLYQSKHAAQVLDRAIVRTTKQTEAVRERTGMLRAEWALLNEPDRLAELARAHLPLQTLKPTQFAAMGDLPSRLPPPAAARVEPLPADPAPEEAAPPPPVAPVAENKPAPPPVPAARPREAEPKKAVADSKPPRVDKPVVAHAEPVHPAEALATPVHARPFAPPPPPVASAEATAPGTVGAAVLRAMRSQGAAYAQGAEPPPMRPSPMPAFATPAYAPPAYATPAYAPPPSVLGGRPALPPPVPFAAR